MSNFILNALFSLSIGFFIGWIYAHLVVATECRNLGGFYVGKTVFKCVEIKESKE